MKLLFVFLISFSAMGGSYFPVGKEGAKTSYAKKAKCEKNEGQECFNLQGKNLDSVKVVQVDEEVDDPDKPVFGRNKEVQSCDSHEECLSKLQKYRDEETCKPYEGYFPYYKTEDLKVICATISGYEKKVISFKKLEVDEAKKAEYEANQLKLKEELNGIAKNLKDQKFGQSMYALVKHVQKKKGLNKAQRKQVRSSFKEIKTMLLDGDIDLALDEVKKITPDGTLITQEEINSLISRIENYIGANNGN